MESEAESVSRTNSGTKDTKGIREVLCCAVRELKPDVWAALDYPVGLVGV